MTLPILVAHRGDARRCPENSLAALRAALEAGAEWIEFDVQLTADGIPVLLHDDDLVRTAGVSACVHDLTRAQLDAMDVGEAARFGPEFAGTRLPDLSEAIELLRTWPDRRAFVEIKRSSLRRFGRPLVLDRILSVIAPARSQCVVVSFDAEVLTRARACGASEIGWVIEAWDESVRRAAEGLAPEFLFVNIKRVPPAPEKLWPGPWRWVVYEIETLESARLYGARGAAFAETMSITALRREAAEDAGA